MGESIVKEIRPLLMSGLRKGWTMAGQGTYYRMKTLTYMQDMLLNQSLLNVVMTKRRPIRVATKIYRFSADVESAINNQQPFAFSIFRKFLTRERVIAILICYLKQHYIRILHVADEETFQDPHGFAYFATFIHPTVEHLVIDPINLRSSTLTYLASGIALPSLQPNMYAYIMGNGGKKIQGQNHTFAPTTINKRYTTPGNEETRSSSVLLS